MRTHLLSLLMLTASMLSATTVTYSPDNTSNFANPERGYYEMVEVHLNGNGSGVISDGYFTSGAAAGRSLIMRHYYLEHYSDGGAITQADLNLISADMAKFRQHGFKMIVRFSYGNIFRSESDFSREPEESKMVAHMAQFQSVLADNADVIAVVQAGFIGVWGEWYYSYQFGVNCQKDYGARQRMVEHLLVMTPQDRYLQLRTPQYVADYIGGGYGKANYLDTLTLSQAFTTTDRARLGHHNDAFCNGKENLGTYSSSSTTFKQQKAYLAQMGLYAPMGGETCLGTWDNGYETTYTNYNSGEKADAEMQLLHYDYLNCGYSDYVLNRWKQEYKDGMSYYDIVARRLGYRYQLLSASFSSAANPGKSLTVNLNIANQGYSTLYNARTAYIVLVGEGRTVRLPLTSDPRLWKSGETMTVSEHLTLPANLPTGTYHLYLYLPDAEAALQTNAAYSVRMANTGIWDASTGYNDLKADVQVTNEQVDDNPPVPPTSFVEQDFALDLGTATEPANQSATCSWSLSADSVLTVSYSTSGSWLYTGVSFPLPELEDLVSVSLEYQGSSLDSWTVILPVIEDGANRWYDAQDRPVMDTEWHQTTVLPTTNLWSSATGSYGDRPVTAFTVLVNPMAATTASFRIRNVRLRRLVPAPITTIDTPVEQSRAHKFLRNGQLYIRVADRTYNILGN